MNDQPRSHGGTNRSHPLNGETPILPIPGLDGQSTRTYLTLLTGGSATPAQMARKLSTTIGSASITLEDLRDHGLATRLEGTTQRYSAVDPAFALRAIADQLGRQVLQIHQSLPELAEMFRQTEGETVSGEETKVLTGPAAIAAAYTRLQHQTETEFLAFDRPPYVSASQDPVEAIALRRGVRWRAIYTVESFEDGTTWDEIIDLARQGEDARIATALPIKLAVADQREALISLSLDANVSSALITSSQPLVETFRQLFEHHWTDATPIGTHSPGQTPESGIRRPRSDGRQLTIEDRQLVALMAAGLKDETIARQLQISPRTLRRRSQDLLVELRASTRFQAGAEAMRRGWL
jgi:DNA-binding NarL/FixJ family response regulator